MTDTIASLLLDGRKQLEKAGIDTAALDSRLLLAHSLALTKEEIVRHYHDKVENTQKERFIALLQRRLDAEPMAYILGYKAFYELDFIVSKDTLIPRPDSEVLVERVINYLHTRPSMESIRILELGVGSGCLLLSILHHFPGIYGVGYDRSKEAILIAKENAGKLGLANRVELSIKDWSEGFEGEYDIIISNPPYIETTLVRTLEKSVALYEPHGALDGGSDGLDCYRQLAPIMTRHLKPAGHVFLECGQGQHEAVAEIFNNQGLMHIGFYRDLAGIYRCIELADRSCA